MKRSISSRTREQGSVMVEVLISMLVFAIGVLGLIRVLAVAVRDAGDVEYRAVAATSADEVIGRMWVNPGNLGAYVEDAVALDELPGGTRTVEVDGNVVNVTVTWLPPGAADTRVHTVSATLAAN